MRRVRIAADLVRNYGIGWICYRLRIALQHRFGWEERQMPKREWRDNGGHPEWSPSIPLPAVDRVAVSDFQARYPEAVSACCEEADAILQGTFRRFERAGESLGFPPRWQEEMPGQVHPGRGVHWSKIKPFEDIKLVWELSRMGWAQILGRAYAFSGDERYAEGFWDLLEDWHEENPPNQGPQWMCGQESSIRCLSLVLAANWFKGSPVSTPDRWERMVEIIEATGRRVEPHIHYARSQRNNHALNEALGLLTAGVFLPGTSDALRWIDKGSQIFSVDLLDQLDAEGSYIQHSTYYHRVMLHACAWRMMLARALRQPVDPLLVSRMAAGLRWMVAMVDPLTGEAPNLGSNDGANLLRLASAAYQDHRPAIQGLAALLGLPLPFPPGAWDESVLWLTGLDPLSMPREIPTREDFSALDRGHFVRRNAEGSLYFRCAAYRERPGQSDPLHVDLTWRGLNILCDAGSYRYNAPSPWSNSLAFTGVHNTITIEGRPSMERFGPFLWLDWDQSELLKNKGLDCLAGMRTPTRTFPAKHVRTVLRLGSTHWAVVDDVVAERPVQFCLHWLIPNYPIAGREHGIRLTTPKGEFQLLILGPGAPEIAIGSPEQPDSGLQFGPKGWRSSWYFHREPALSLSCVSLPSKVARWVSIAGEGPFQASVELDCITLQTASDLHRYTLPPTPFSET